MKILILWLINAAALVLTSHLISGIEVDSFSAALVAALVLGLVNTFIRPLVLILTLPATILTLGLFTFVINGCMLYLTSALVHGFEVTSFWAALLGSILMSFISVILSSIAEAF